MSLFFPEMEERYKDVVVVKNNTYEWLHQHESFKKWISQGKGLLWINGKPGSGKSTLMRYAFDNLIASREKGDTGVFLSFFYHGRGNHLQKTAYGLHRALLYQLLDQVPDELQDLVCVFEKKCRTQGKAGETWQWNEHDLKKFFESSLSKILESRPVWIFVDAIDECGQTPAVNLSKHFVHLLKPSFLTSQFHICFSCRHYPALTLDDVPEICMEHENKKDISTYVRTQLHEHTETAPALLNTITQRAKGVFMWACLVVQRFQEMRAEGESYSVIEKEIDKTLPDLEELYTKIVQDMKSRSASLRLLRWICFAIRPLSLEELRWAMVIDANLQSDKKFQSLRECRYAGDFPCDCKSACGCDLMGKKVRTLSCGLVEVVESSGKQTVQFIHQSTQDFFIEKGLAILDEGFSIGYAHYQLSRTCIRYLAMKEICKLPICVRDAVSPGFMEELLRGDVDDKSFSGVTNYFSGLDMDGQLTAYATRCQWNSMKYTPSTAKSFLHYASTAWMVHTRESEKRNVSQDDLLDYFNWPSERLVRLWAWVHRILSGESVIFGSRMIHAVSRYQLMGPLQLILERKGGGGASSYVNTRDIEDRTALSQAAGSGNYDVVQLLLQNGADTSLKETQDGTTALHFAAMFDREDVVELLLHHGAEIDVQDNRGVTPLMYASGIGLESIAELLIKHGANVNMKDNRGQAPLDRAEQEGNSHIVKLLLRHGAKYGFDIVEA
jgi:Ankyrin repeats (3 copies)/Ankyrin repeat/NACHT domain